MENLEKIVTEVARKAVKEYLENLMETERGSIPEREQWIEERLL